MDGNIGSPLDLKKSKYPLRICVLVFMLKISLKRYNINYTILLKAAQRPGEEKCIKF